MTEIDLIWAKRDPCHPLMRHCIDVAMVCRRLLESPLYASAARLLIANLNWPCNTATMHIAYVVGLHDIGKCDGDFQGKWPERKATLEAAGLPFRDQAIGGFRHELRGRQWLHQFLTEECRWSEADANTISLVIGGHHGSFNNAPGIYELPTEKKLQKAAWNPLRQEIARLMARCLGVPFELPAPAIADHSIVGVLLLGLLVTSDWIASNEDLFQWHTLSADVSIEEYARLSNERAEAALRRLGFLERLPFCSGASFLETWAHLKIDRPRPIQKVISDLCLTDPLPDLTIIEAPMGEGKTEAALHLATQWAARGRRGGIYVALPTAATSNQMHERVKALAGQHGGMGVGLIHGMSWVLDEATPQHSGQHNESQEDDDSALEWFRPSRRALLSPLAVGTVDQALMATLHVRFGFLRLLGLAKGVLVIDEVHAYDAYMSTILDRLLHWCGKLQVPVVMLSATLTGRQKCRLMAAYQGQKQADAATVDVPSHYPLITLLDQTGTRQLACPASGEKQVDVQCHAGLLEDTSETAKLALKSVAGGGCACVLLNTVASAQNVYEELRDRVPADTRLILFHARFPAERRAELEREVLELFDKRSLSGEDDPQKTVRPGKAILVATQVVEQSLDVDFDVLITQIAPLDLLLQRLGRLHRHNRPQRPTGYVATVHILLPKHDDNGRPRFKASERVYPRYILLRTLAIIRCLPQPHISLPTDLRPLVEAAYEVSATCPENWRGQGVTEDDLAESLAKMRKEREEMEGKAAKQLIPEPYERSFKLAHQGVLLEESDENSSSYFRAATRYGNDTIRVLVLEGDEFRTELASHLRPTKEVLRRMLLREVSLSTWWIASACPINGYEPVLSPQRWLGGRRILRMIKGTWKGRCRGDNIEVKYDPYVGVSNTKLNNLFFD